MTNWQIEEACNDDPTGVKANLSHPPTMTTQCTRLQNTHHLQPPVNSPQTPHLNTVMYGSLNTVNSP